MRPRPAPFLLCCFGAGLVTGLSRFQDPRCVGLGLLLLALCTRRNLAGFGAAAALVGGLLIGAINGVLVGYMRIPPMLATLGTLGAGLGVALLPEDELAPHLSDGSLVRVLEDWCPPFAGYHLYYPSRRQPSPAFSLVVKALRVDRPLP